MASWTGLPFRRFESSRISRCPVNTTIALGEVDRPTTMSAREFPVENSSETVNLAEVSFGVQREIALLSAPSRSSRCSSRSAHEMELRPGRTPRVISIINRMNVV